MRNPLLSLLFTCSIITLALGHLPTTTGRTMQAFVVIFTECCVRIVAPTRRVYTARTLTAASALILVRIVRTDPATIAVGILGVRVTVAGALKAFELLVAE